MYSVAFFKYSIVQSFGQSRLGQRFGSTFYSLNNIKKKFFFPFQENVILDVENGIEMKRRNEFKNPTTFSQGEEVTTQFQNYSNI